MNDMEQDILEMMKYRECVRRKRWKGGEGGGMCEEEEVERWRRRGNV